jgi:hypothetical protein
MLTLNLVGPQRGRGALAELARKAAEKEYENWTDEEIAAARQQHEAEKANQKVTSRRIDGAAVNRQVEATVKQMEKLVSPTLRRSTIRAVMIHAHHGPDRQADDLNLRTGAHTVVMVLRGRHGDTYDESFIATKEARNAAKHVWSSTIEGSGLRLQSFILSGYEGAWGLVCSSMLRRRRGCLTFG